MTKLLFLDDMEARHEMARQICEEVNIEMWGAHTAEQAIKLLEDVDFDLASLDCDLADDHYSGPYASPSMGGTAHSGRAVARWIAEHGGPGHIMIHSWNFAGREDMLSILKDYPCVVAFPFGNPATYKAWLNGSSNALPK